MTPDEMDDPLPDIIAGLDQALAMAPELARTTKGLFDAYLAQGFSESQSVYLAACTMHGEPGKAP